MNGYRSTVTGGGGGVDNAGDYTFTLVNGGARSYVNGSCRGMFDGNTTINAPILIGRAVNTCAEMLNGCTNFNQNLDLHGEIVNCYKMLCGCTSFAKNLYFHSRTKAINTVGILENTSNLLRKNIWFQPSMNTYFNNTDASSVVGQPITWTAISNGYYNAAFNVYCYYNYTN